VAVVTAMLVVLVAAVAVEPAAVRDGRNRICHCR